MSTGSTLSRLPSIPSMSTSGAVELPPNELIPRMRMAPPSAPDGVVTVTPGAIPCKATDAETTGRFSKVEASIVDTEPVTLTFF